MHALQALGERLVAMPPERLAGLELPERLIDAIALARRLTGFEARRRQMQYIGRLMRDVDAAPIADRVDALRQEAGREAARQHMIEHWRDRLLDDESALTELAHAHPRADLPHLRTLIRNARRAREGNEPPHAARALFRALRELLAADHAAEEARPESR